MPAMFKEGAHNLMPRVNPHKPAVTPTVAPTPPPTPPTPPPAPKPKPKHSRTNQVQHQNKGQVHPIQQAVTQSPIPTAHATSVVVKPEVAAAVQATVVYGNTQRIVHDPKPNPRGVKVTQTGSQYTATDNSFSLKKGEYGTLTPTGTVPIQQEHPMSMGSPSAYVPAKHISKTDGSAKQFNDDKVNFPQSVANPDLKSRTYTEYNTTPSLDDTNSFKGTFDTAHPFGKPTIHRGDVVAVDLKYGFTLPRQDPFGIVLLDPTTEYSKYHDTSVPPHPTTMTTGEASAPHKVVGKYDKKVKGEVQVNIHSSSWVDPKPEDISSGGGLYFTGGDRDDWSSTYTEPYLGFGGGQDISTWQNYEKGVTKVKQFTTITTTKKLDILNPATKPSGQSSTMQNSWTRKGDVVMRADPNHPATIAEKDNKRYTKKENKWNRDFFAGEQDKRSKFKIFEHWYMGGGTHTDTDWGTQTPHSNIKSSKVSSKKWQQEQTDLWGEPF